MTDRNPGKKKTMRDMTPKQVIDRILALKEECDQVTEWRRNQNRANRQRYFGLADWDHKQSGQSCETLPHLSIAADQFGHLVSAALLTNPRWFDLKFRDPMDPGMASVFATSRKEGVDIGAAMRAARVAAPQAGVDPDTIPPHPAEYVTEGAARRLFAYHLDQCSFVEKFAQATKLATLECESWLKVEPIVLEGDVSPLDELLVEDDFAADLEDAEDEAKTILEGEPRSEYNVLKGERMEEPEEDKASDRLPQHWMLNVQVVPYSEVWADPWASTSPLSHGRPRWLIHEYEVTWDDLLAFADRISGADTEALRGITPHVPTKEADQARSDALMGHCRTADTYVVTEFWGRHATAEGEIRGRLIIVNKQHLLSRIATNDPWPFFRVRPVDFPGTLGRALFDDVGALNQVLDEMFNLILDGGLAAVWGIKQLRADYLVNPSDVQDGIPQGCTLNVNNTMPPGEKVLETVTTGQVPADAFATLQLVKEEVQRASRLAEFQLGSIPSGGDVRASSVVSARESQTISLTSIARSLDRISLVPALRHMWETIVFGIEWMDTEILGDLVGRDAAARLKYARANDKRSLWSAFGQADVVTSGVSEAVERTRDALRLDQGTRLAIGVAQAAPALAAVGLDPLKIIAKQLRFLGIDQDEIKLDAGVDPTGLAQQLTAATTPPNQQQAPGQGKQPPGRPPGTSNAEETPRGEVGEPDLIRSARSLGQTDAQNVANMTGRTGRRIQ